MNYEVQLVNDEELPEGRDVVIVERGGALPAVMLLCGRPAQVWRAMREWECSQGAGATPTRLFAV